MLDQDEKIKSHLAKKEKIYGAINQNKFYLEKSLTNFEKNGSKTLSRSTLSPRTLSPLRSPYR